MTDNIVLPEKNINRSVEDEQEPHFSFSQLSMFLRCSMQYYFRYVKGLIIPPNLPMQSGKAMHKAIEYNSLHKMSKGVDMDEEGLTGVLSDSHDKYTQELDANERRGAGKDKDQSISILSLYRRQQAPHIEPIQVEYKFIIDVSPDEKADNYLPVLGYVDSYARVPDARIGHTTGQKVVALEDYKKVNRRKSQDDIDLSPQLTLYDYVFHLETNAVADVVGFRQLGFTRDGPYSQPVYRTGTTLERRMNRWQRVMNQIRRAQKQIAEGNFIPVDDARVCSWCGYRDICQDRKDF